MNIFLTGATGLLGTNLLQALTKGSNCIYTLVRDKNRAEAMFRQYLIDMSNVILVEGDLAQQNLGLDDTSFLKSVELVYHLGATISLSNEQTARDAIFAVNVNGTKELLRLLEDNASIQQFIFISTAYACGRTPATVPESWLHPATSFRNFYEQSKYEAEKTIKTYSKKNKLPYTIIRPSLFLSDNPLDFSKLINQTIYAYGMAAIAPLLQLQNPPDLFRLVGNPNSVLNFVKIDDLVKVILYKHEPSTILNVTNSFDMSVEVILESFTEGLGVPSKVAYQKTVHTENPDEIRIHSFTKHFTQYTLSNEVVWEKVRGDAIKRSLKITPITLQWIEEHLKNFAKTFQERNLLNTISCNTLETNI